ncbi:histidine kinase [Zafaria cholistanensis]|uniref:histidine kinase n=1 Tax=Zafaria cholistanensis TaxID=1682741 RepID=A0A5A7NTW3_9MICC|nr:ATP-binding protein [Zafaria cholistanensis]GER24295.1 histidine kinase [Zafaria cholistanensis]
MGPNSLAAQLFLWQLVLITAVATAVGVASYRHAEHQVRSDVEVRVSGMAALLARDPFVVDAVAQRDPSALLQPFAQEIVTVAKVDFVTFMDTDRTRYSHPDPAQVGRAYIGSVDEALAGRMHVEEYTGALGPSVRAIAPIRDRTGTVQAMVAVGLTLESVNIAQAAALPAIAGIAAAAVALGGLAAWVLSSYLRRVTAGYGPAELRRLFTYYDSALHSLREGLVLLDDSRRLVLYNDHAAALLGLEPGGPAAPVPVAELGLPGSLAALLTEGREAVDEVFLAGDRLLVVSQRATAALRGSGAHGSVVTLRDHTELRSLSDRLHGLRTLVQALRAQTHEHANRMHAIASLLELGRTADALEFATRDLHESQRMTDRFVQAIDEPFLASLLVGKAAQAHERGVELVISGAGTLPPGAIQALDLVTVVGNLVDNAIDAAAGAEPARVWVDLVVDEAEAVLTVADSGPGLPTLDLDQLMRLGSTTKATGEAGGRGYGLALVRRTLAAGGGTLTAENDGGAVFTAVLPLRRQGPGAPAPRPAADGGKAP